MTDDKYLDTEEKVAAVPGLRHARRMLFKAKRVWGTACYTITPQGAEKLLKLVLPLRNGKIDTIYRTGLWMQPRKCTFPVLGIDGDMGLIAYRQADGARRRAAGRRAARGAQHHRHRPRGRPLPGAVRR